jgi:hypothetical protein
MVGLVVLAACSPGAPVAPQTQQAAAPGVASEAPAQMETTAAPGATQAEPSAPTLVAVKSALEATDPATVELASGGPLLVEFFAFW